jgi:hypothetical protein
MKKQGGRQNRRIYQNNFAKNRNAFVDVFGDPFAQPEVIEGQYQNLKSRGLRSMLGNVGEGKPSGNMANPSPVDFFCDVDKIVTNALCDEEYRRFMETYIYENKAAGLSATECTAIEQRLGKLFRNYGISPVVRYFMAFRKKCPKRNRNEGKAT